MNNAYVTVDTSAVQKAFDGLTPKELRTATRAAFRKSVNIMKAAVRKEYKSAFPGSILYKDIHAAAFRSGKGAIVDLKYLPKHAKGDPLYKSYILRMLERGTSERETKKGYNRGSITGAGFYAQGIAASEHRAQETLQKNIEDALLKKAKQVGLTVR